MKVAMGNREIRVESQMSGKSSENQSVARDLPQEASEDIKIWPSDKGALCVVGDNFSSQDTVPPNNEPSCTAISVKPALVDSSKRNRVKKIQKQVRFNDDQLTNVIEFEDDEDSKQMRRLYWEIYAIDRSRFNDRISRTESAISHIFSKEHRDKVYADRLNPQRTKMVQEDINRNIPDPSVALSEESSKDDSAAGSHLSRSSTCPTQQNLPAASHTRRNLTKNRKKRNKRSQRS